MTENLLSDEDLARCAQIVAAHRGPIADIVRAVCAETGIRPVDIYAPGPGLRHVSQARQLIMFIARRRGLTVTKIGRYLNRDHTTVVHGARAEQARRDQQ